MTAPAFCYNLGYGGFVKFKSYLMLATDGSFQLTHNHMFTSGVWGGNIKNASAHIASAPDYPSVSANVGFQLTTQSNFWSDLGQSITQQRYKWNQVTIYPNGVAGYNSPMYTQSLQYSTSQDSLVIGSASFKGAEVDSVLTDAQGNFAAADHKSGHGNTYISSLSPGYRSVFPYYGTQWVFSGAAKGVKTSETFLANQLAKDVIAWSITASQQINFVKVCNCVYEQLDQISADFAILGLMQVSGNAQLIGINERFKNGSMFYFIDNTNTITMKSSDGAQTRTIKIPNMQCTNISSSIQNGANLITTSFDFMVMGNKSNDKYLISYS